MRALAILVLALGGLQIPLDDSAISDALRLANSSMEPAHLRFHADYRIQVNAPPIDFISIVTPFRRVVLSAESAARLGGKMFGQREAVAALQPDPERVEIYVELTFHPLNTFLGVPDYTVSLEPQSFRAPPIVPDAIDRFPRFNPRLEDRSYPFPYPFKTAPRAPTGSQPVLGGTIIARLPGGKLDPKGTYAVVVREGKTELGRARLDLARLR